MNAKTKAPLVIAMTPVESSQIAAIGHDAGTNTLAIQFKPKSGPGSIYHYQNVTTEQFEEFKKSESVGSHFYKAIKPFADKFPYTRIETPKEKEEDGEEVATENQATKDAA